MALNNSLTKANQKLGIAAYLSADSVKAQINNVLGSKNGTRFITSIVSAVTNNKQLQECSNGSIVSAALLGESLNLSPSPQLGMYYLVPYNSKDGTIAQFQMGYKGFVQLAIRSGCYKKLNVLPIKEGELVRFDALNEEIEVNLIPDEEAREKAKTIGYYAMFEYTNGFRKAIYWSKSKMESHALRYSKGYAAKKGYTFWEKDFDAMACKTMIRQLISKWGVMSTDFEKAYEADQGVIGENGSITYVDNDNSVAETPNEEPIMPPPVEAEVVENPKKKSAPKADEEDAEAIAKALFK